MAKAMNTVRAALANLLSLEDFHVLCSMRHAHILNKVEMHDHSQAATVNDCLDGESISIGQVDYHEK